MLERLTISERPSLGILVSKKYVLIVLECTWTLDSECMGRAQYIYKGIILEYLYVLIIDIGDAIF